MRVGGDVDPAVGTTGIERTPPGACERCWALLALTALAAYTAFFYRDLLFGDRVYVFRDIYTLFFAFEHTARILAHWHWPPLWDPLAALGRPFAADLMTAVYYPFNWGLRVLPESHSLNLSIALHHFIAAAGLFALLRYHRLSLMPATLGAVGFGFGGLMVSFDNVINCLQSAVWLPWMILAFEVWCARRTAAAVVGMAVVLGMAVLGATPEFVVFANALTVALAVDRSRSGAGPNLVHSLTALLVANGLALGLCAVQLVPFAEYVMHSSRFTGLLTEGVTAYSLLPLGVLAFFVPRHYVAAGGQFHETAALWEGNLTNAPLVLTLYLGVILVLLVAAFGRLSRFQRWWWGGIGAAFLALALGKNLPGYVWLVEHVTLLRLVRYPEKFLVVVHGLLAVGVALGLESALCAPARFRGVALAAAGLAVAALVAHRVVAVEPTWPAPLLAADLRLLALLSALAAALAVAARTRPRAAAFGFLLLAAADVYRVNGRLLPTVPWAAVQRIPRTVEVMKRGDDPLRIYSDGLGRPVVPAFPDSFVQEQNLLLMHDANFYLIGNLNAPAGITLADQEALEEAIERLPRERVARGLAAFNVAYVTSPKELRYPGLKLLQPPRNTLEAYVFEVERCTPRAFVPVRLHAVTTREEAIEHLRDEADPSVEVAVAADSIPPNVPAVIDGAVRIASYLPERVELLAQMRTPGIVVLADTYYPGWQASVDDMPAAVVRANYFVRGVYVGAGEHRIVFRYAPLSHRVGSMASGLTGGALLLGMVWTQRGRHRGCPRG